MSQRTLQSTGTALPHSPSLDAIGQQTDTSGRVTTKDATGKTYILLETASVTTAGSELPPSLSPTSENKKEAEHGQVGREDKSGGENHVTQRNRGVPEAVGSKSSRRNGGNRLTSSLPADSEKCSPVTTAGVNGGGGGGVSTRTATELASRKDQKLQNTNVSLFPLCPL